MDINEILSQLDWLFTNKKAKDAEGFLMEHLTKAIYDDQHEIQIILMNELIGYYRSAGRHSDATAITDRAIRLLGILDLNQSEHYATTLLNGATAYREAGNLKKALSMYQESLSCYQRLLPASDYRFAGLYNNMSGIYSKVQDYKTAILYLDQALSILSRMPGTEFELAATYTNLAANYLHAGDLVHASSYAADALDIYQKDGKEDSHKAALFALLGQIYAKKKDYREAVSYYRLAMRNSRRFFGKNHFYLTLCEECADICSILDDRILEEQLRMEAVAIRKADFESAAKPCALSLSRLYYEEYGRPMIHEKFPEYESRIAIGLAGHGSECFGFDDEYSMDHDYGPSFCMWLTSTDYNEIGERLMQEYEKLPKEYLGCPARQESIHGKNRIGVMEIKAFYQEFLGDTISYREALTRSGNTNISVDWSAVSEQGLASATNGTIFRDDLGAFRSVRTTLLSYYPEEIWLKKLAQSAALMAQSGQYNYARCMRRKDTVAAQAALQEFTHASISMVYLLNKAYMPYYKWMFKGMENLPLLTSVSPLIKKLAELPCQMKVSLSDKNEVETVSYKEDEKVIIIEQICALVAEELKQQQLSNAEDSYLELHAVSILDSANRI